MIADLLLRYLTIPAVGAIIAAAAVPAAQAINLGDQPGVRLVQATQRSEVKADALSATLDNFIPGAPAPRQESKTDQTLAKAMALLARLDQIGGDCPPERPDCPVRVRTQQQSAIADLRSAWQPRYDRALDEFERFEERITRCRGIADEYFAIQRELTARLAPDDRRLYAEYDAAEFERYRQWQDQADRTLRQAEDIMADLHNLNIIITKLELSAEFSALYASFVTLPAELTQLHRELDQFRQQSDLIQSTFGTSD